MLLHILLHLVHLGGIEQVFEDFVHESLGNHLKLLVNLRDELEQSQVEFSDHIVLVHIVEETILNGLLRGLLVNVLLNTLALAIPPSTKSLGRLEDVAVELLQLATKLIHTWMVGEVQTDVLSLHLDQWLPVLTKESLCSGQCSNHHCDDGIEDLSLPIVVIDLHLWLHQRSCLEGRLLNGLQVDVSNVLVVLDELVNFLDSVGLKEV